MSINLQIEDANNGESEQDNSSDAEHLLVALRKMMKKEMEVMVIRTVQKVIGPIVEDLIRKVVKEEIQSAQEKFLTHQNRNSVDEATLSRPRSLELKFLDKLSDSILTGKEFKGKEGNLIRVSLVDIVTGDPFLSGPEASAKVEILILKAGPNDNAHNENLKDFNNSIIRENEKTKPHFPKPVYVYLEKGIGVLSNVKLGHDARWMKSCKCRLGARVVDKFDGSTVKEAWTESFMVLDSRCKLYEKHYPPSLSDPVWRLDNIGKDGARCKRLHEAMIFTVQEFLFLLSIDPQRLQEILGAGGKKWKATVDHAHTCPIDDRKIYSYNPSTEHKTGVVFNIVGKLKGVLRNNQFVPIESVYVAEKFPCISNDKNATNSSGLDGSDGRNSSIVENIDLYDPTQPVTAGREEERSTTISQGISPSINHSNISCPFGSLSSINVEDLHEWTLGPLDKAPSFSTSDLDFLLESFLDNEALSSPTLGDNENLPEIRKVESYSDQQSNAGSIRFVGAVITLRWLFRVRKRVASLGDNQVHKRQRHR
ncbi:calmodulin-binding protein 60 A-like isoform X2 [Olea europaea var. sylvestris]|uniref:Calmodulin-binding 60 A-like isoform X2 n=1 Tax=Olea europaea subsp. europaea TaxID=158383 RepID=A0A8S0RXF4_OLEEU|nr:calmodulin-binding protein 60 A-like isoform X2 [Olea europaea var. sylvestris]CAA2983639.1 calmodulin-binding 60 A-like isoform X2 [Olea europaea subsp. europaea]